MPINTLQACCFEPLCALAVVRQKAEKVRKDQEIQWKNDRLELDRSKLSWQHAQTKTSFNRMRVLEEKVYFAKIGKELECISCGKKNMDWCCGHLKTVGAQGNLRYDRKNTYLQCNKYCNKSLSGNIEGNKNTRGYKQGLRDRFGEEEGNKIIEYCETHTEVKKWTREEIEALRKECNKRIRELELELNQME